MSKKDKAKAWRQCSRYIRLKHADKNGDVKCVTCDTVKHWKEMQAGHFMQGRSNSILFEEENIHPQCPRCNLFEDGNLIPYTFFMIETYGEEKIHELQRLKNSVRKWYPGELQEIHDYFKSRADEIENKTK